jgi:predicted transcriptional regulator
MRRSIIEMKIDILNALFVTNKSLKLTHLTLKTNMNGDITKEMLNQLVAKGLVSSNNVVSPNKTYTKRTNGIIYTITPLGVETIHVFNKISPLLL